LGNFEAGQFFSIQGGKMAQSVWVLSVDLQAKTATFQSGMADAAKSACGSFNDIKTGSSEMGGHVQTNMFASRHAIMAVSEAFGDTMPRAITALIVHIGPLGAALEAAFPFAAIALGAVLLIEHFTKLQATGVHLTQTQKEFGIAAVNAFNQLDQKLLQSQIRADELRNDHLGALKKQLELIDRQSMAELAKSFEDVGKRADGVFAEMQTKWFSFSRGSDGAKASMLEFGLEYRKMLADGDKAGASKLLAEKFEREKHVLEQLQQMEAGRKEGAVGSTHEAGALKYEAARTELKRMNVDYEKESAASMQLLVLSLHEQMEAEKEIASIKKSDSSNANVTAGKDASAKKSEAARQAAEHTTKMGEISLAAQREQAQVSQAINNATIAERLASDIAFADKEYEIQQQSNHKLIDALNTSGPDYNNQLKALQEKALELTATHENTVGILKGKAAMEQYRKDLADMETGEREKINATDQGSTERLAVIDAALKAEDALNLQATAHYRELLTQRVQVAREAATEESKLRAEAGKIAADNEEKMGQLRLAAAKESFALADSSHRISIQARLQQEIQAANQTTALQMTVMAQQIAALDKGGKDYNNKLQELQNKQKQLVQAHENEITDIKNKAEIDRNTRILSAENRFNQELSSGLTQVVMGHKSFAAMLNGIGNQIVSGMLQNAIQSILANDMTKESDAAKAARKAFNIGMELPFPANVIAGPLMGAAAFAAVMAFESGSDGVPGVGRGDTVPAMLTPGEGVVPGGVMDGLRGIARSGGFNRAPVMVKAHFAPTIHAIDAAGVDGMLQKHGDRFQRHLENSLRKLNR
jgi:hypothetical protein